MTDLGTMTVEGTTRTLRYERHLPHPPAAVWAALTEPDRLSDWLAAAEVEPGPDGTITLDFGEGGTEKGRITTWDPPRSLAYEWNFVGETPTHVSWELVPEDDGAATLLTLVHAQLEAGVAPDYGAGWHAHLDGLAGHLSGAASDWGGRFQELRPRYAEIAGVAA